MPQRSASYVEPIAPDMGAVVAEGSYFCVNNAQTGIATAAAPTAYSDTNPFLAIYNQEAAGGKSILLDFLALIATAAGTAGASLQAAIQIDRGDRYASGGTDLTSRIKNPNGGAGNSSIAKVRAGNITAAALTSEARMIVGNRYLKGAIPVAGDTYGLKFGAVDPSASISISTIMHNIQAVPKIIIPPSWSCLVHLWLPSQSAASSYIPELGWVERTV